MKGIVFNLLENVVVKTYGDDTWDALLDASGVPGSYTSLGSYADEDMMALVAAASAALGKQPADILRWFGREAMPLLAGHYPQFFAPYTSARPFIVSVNSIIHPEVRKIYPGAVVPVFGFDDTHAETLWMTYRSPRKMCALAEGFADGAARHFSETVALNHARCMHDGDDHCSIGMTFVKTGDVQAPSHG